MSLNFQWDENKAESNLSKHGVNFEEAATVFGDPFSLTIPDPAHSQSEDRFIILGTSHNDKLLVVVHTDAERVSASSARGVRAAKNARLMKKAHSKTTEPEMQAEYDFSGAERGKYARRYAQGTNVVVLEPDVAKAFPNAEAVNSSLRALVSIIKRREKAVASK